MIRPAAFTAIAIVFALVACTTRGGDTSSDAEPSTQNNASSDPGLSPAESGAPTTPTLQEDAASPAEAASDAGVGCGGGRCSVRVVGGHLERDGKPWTPKGAVVTGLVAPPSYLKGVYADAHAAWSPTLLAGLRALGADTVRFNVSVAALDPQNALPDGALDAAGKAAYLASIVDAVHLAESHGMNVMLTMQTGDVAGDPNEEDTPGNATKRAWSVVAPVFKDDPAVVFIAFNEPGFGGAATIDQDPSPWLAWRDGYAKLVAAIRAAGATNVVVLDGLSTSRVWRNNSEANVPTDPSGQLAYDIHPFPTDSTQETKGGAKKLDYLTPAHIDYWLGGWCDARACIATAFFSGIGNNPDVGNCYDGTEDSGFHVTSPEIVRTFANHLASKNIGVMAFALDWKNRLFEDPSASSLVETSFAGFTTCSGPKRMAVGAAMRALWTTGNVPAPTP